MLKINYTLKDLNGQSKRKRAVKVLEIGKKDWETQPSIAEIWQTYLENFLKYPTTRQTHRLVTVAEYECLKRWSKNEKQRNKNKRFDDSRSGEIHRKR